MGAERPIVVTGASSFLGAHVVRFLVRTTDRPVIALVNRTPLALAEHAPDRVVSLDLASPHADDVLAELLPAAIVHLACKVMPADGPAQNLAMLDAVLAACRRIDAGLVHASTTQVHWTRKNAYALGRIDEERRIEQSELPYVILRPCAPYGPRLPDHTPHHRESFHVLADTVRRGLVVPMIGTGIALRQPVHVDDWSDVVARFATRRASDLPNQAFDVGGPEALQVRRLVDLMALALGKTVRQIPIPTSLCRLAAPLVPGLSPEQIATFSCDDTVDLKPLIAETGKTGWILFEDGARDLVGAGWSLWGRRTGILTRTP